MRFTPSYHIKVIMFARKKEYPANTEPSAKQILLPAGNGTIGIEDNNR